MTFSTLPDATFSQRVKKLRLERGLTRKALSLKAGLTKDLVWRWERGWHGARRRSIEKVALVLGVFPEQLLTGGIGDAPEC